MVVTNYPDVKLYFRFYGESFDPDEITRRLGIEPTAQRRPGDPLTKDGRGICRDYSWMVKIGPSETLYIDDMLIEFRERISVSAAEVRQLCQDLNLELVIVCGVGMGTADDLPVTYFPQDFVKWAAEMNAAINVDIIL